MVNSLDRFVYKMFVSLYRKQPRLIDHSKTGHFSPVFEWFTSLDHFIYKEKEFLYVKWSRLMVWRPSCFWTIRKPDIFVRFSNGLNRPSKCPDFEWIRFSNGRISDPYCNSVSMWRTILLVQGGIWITDLYLGPGHLSSIWVIRCWDHIWVAATFFRSLTRLMTQNDKFLFGVYITYVQKICYSDPSNIHIPSA